MSSSYFFDIPLLVEPLVRLILDDLDPVGLRAPRIIRALPLATLTILNL